MRHVFRATKIGWDKEQEGIWFDSDMYTEEEARAQFKPFQGTTQRGYPYTGYEYDGQKYHDFTYLGEFEDDEMPKNNMEYIRYSTNLSDVDLKVAEKEAEKYGYRKAETEKPKKSIKASLAEKKKLTQGSNAKASGIKKIKGLEL